MLPTRDEAIGELERVLASEVFASASRLSRFLRFVAERSLAGESERLKEYVIGVEVFDRDERYDPRVDSIVRVEAGRLRTKLEQYYHGAGRDDAIVIRLQKGGYAPSFERRNGAVAAPTLPAPPATTTPAISPADATAAAEPAARPPRRWARTTAIAAVSAAALAVAAALTSELWLPPASANAIAVLPFEPYGGTPEDRVLAERITEAVTAALVRSGQIGVVPSRNAREAEAAGSAQSIARRLDANWLLEARLIHDGARLRVEARLLDAARNGKVWVETFVGDPADLDELSRRIAAGAVAGLPDDAAGER